MTIDEIAAVAERDRPFYEESGGGITVSGGEPLLQYRFVVELLRRFRNMGINTAVESAFFGSREALELMAAETDFFLADIKVFDEEQHRRVTGVSNKTILENLRWLDESGRNYCLRLPLIPEVNDDEVSIREIAGFVEKLKNLKYLEFMPYHQMGEAKYTTLGIKGKTGLKAPSKERMTDLAALFYNFIEVRF
jgi:pyruvate formate lyase activating enzyme